MYTDLLASHIVLTNFTRDNARVRKFPSRCILTEFSLNYQRYLNFSFFPWLIQLVINDLCSRSL